MFPEKYILLGERALANTARLFEKTHSCPCVLDSLIIRDIVTGIKTPLQLKVNPDQTPVFPIGSNTLNVLPSLSIILSTSASSSPAGKSPST